MRKKYDSGILFSKKLILCIMLSPYKYQSESESEGIMGIFEKFYYMSIGGYIDFCMIVRVS